MRAEVILNIANDTVYVSFQVFTMARASYVILLVVVGAVFADACSSSG